MFSAICKGVADFALCPGSTWTCDVKVSQCFCKSETPYCSYTGGGAQVLSNPYARARNPYEEHNASAEPYSHHTSHFAYEEQRMAPPAGASEYRSALPRAQIGRPY
ncbi:hypothetical protein C0J50_10166 [Silurus asotus]|uniref:Uncharacterized protein n=1 Tax=Silurus asotus TaxID=30991 RepID=A0AAD5FW18_SILAS|nr:hypothetical protein C0J50_10166 [Silurus asotus]